MPNVEINNVAYWINRLQSEERAITSMEGSDMTFGGGGGEKRFEGEQTGENDGIGPRKLSEIADRIARMARRRDATNLDIAQLYMYMYNTKFA